MIHNLTPNATPKTLKSSVSALVESGQLDSVGLGASDFNGIFRGKYLPAAKFVSEIESPMAIGDMFFAFDPGEGVTSEGPDEGWWPLSERGFKEMRARPIPETFRLVPWRDRTAVALADFAFNNGEVVDAAPRRVLARVLERALALGFRPMTGYELEFYVFRETNQSLADKHHRDLEPFASRHQAWGMSGAGDEERLLRLFRENLEAFGIPVETWLVEGGRGQYEFNVPYAEALESADRAFLHRFAVKELAQREGLTATFMARPPGAAYGSSMHLHHSLWSADGANVMYDQTADDRLSSTARHFIAGQLACQHELTALLAPNVNSYKRLLPGMSAGANATWALENWSTGVRVIAASPTSTRVEFRTAGADANPYLAIAATLAAGLHGIEHQLEPPPATRGLGDDAAARKVPGSLAQAIVALDQSSVARDYLGDHFVDVYLATREGELGAFQAAVTDWETERYLSSL